MGQDGRQGSLSLQDDRVSGGGEWRIDASQRGRLIGDPEICKGRVEGGLHEEETKSSPKQRSLFLVSQLLSYVTGMLKQPLAE